MFTYVLTFVACLGAAGDRCRNVELPWDGSLMQCMLFGQQAAAQWTSEHPGWAVAARVALRERPVGLTFAAVTTAAGSPPRSCARGAPPRRRR